MIGDNLETDVLFGINCDIATLLVMTGKSHAKAIATITASSQKLTNHSAWSRCHQRIPPIGRTQEGHCTRLHREQHRRLCGTGRKGNDSFVSNTRWAISRHDKTVDIGTTSAEDSGLRDVSLAQ